MAVSVHKTCEDLLSSKRQLVMQSSISLTLSSSPSLLEWHAMFCL